MKALPPPHYQGQEYTLFSEKDGCISSESYTQLKFSKLNCILDTFESHSGLPRAVALSQGGNWSTWKARPEGVCLGSGSGLEPRTCILTKQCHSNAHLEVRNIGWKQVPTLQTQPFLAEGWGSGFRGVPRVVLPTKMSLEPTGCRSKFL